MHLKYRYLKCFVLLIFSCPGVTFGAGGNQTRWYLTMLISCHAYDRSAEILYDVTRTKESMVSQSVPPFYCLCTPLSISNPTSPDEGT
mmetsp:Transcript_40773/g.69639  ORF Transcript_40773/g.69639 Transcript_40773/m.69639 type:complete len:88 (-) Transcript_40773:64-327(-)